MDLNIVIKFLKNANAPSALIDYIIKNIKIEEKEPENEIKSQKRTRKKKVK